MMQRMFMGLIAFISLGVLDLGAQPVTFVDAVGKTITIDKPIQRMVVFVPVGYAALKIMGVTNRVVGINEYIRDDPTLFPDAKKTPVVQSTGQDINYEALLALRPDAVLTTYWTPDDLDKKLGSKVPVIRLNMGQPETYIEDFRTLARVMGKQAEMEPFLNWVGAVVKDLDQRAATLDRTKLPKVFAFYGGEYGYSDGPPYGTYGKDNRYARLIIEKAGGNNLGSQLAGDWITVDPEWVVTQNPDVIIRSVYTTVSGPLMGWDGTMSSAAKAFETLIPASGPLKASAAWAHKKVYLLSGDLDGIAWFINYAIVLKVLHPEVSKDLNPTALHAEFLNKWMKLKYDPAQQGAFLFPSL